MPVHDNNLAPEDDAVIGRAFRWSLVLIVTAAGLMATTLWWLRVPEKTPSALDKTIGQVADLPAAAADLLPAIPFKDITREAGIDFVHVSGARGAKFLPEAMGSGAAFFDHDGDGHQDLLLVNSTRWPADTAGPGESSAPTHALYRNDGSGSFTDVTVAAGLALQMYGMGAAVADFDGDGDTDIYLTALGPNKLLRNDEGRFTDITTQAGVAGADDAWSTSAGFFDADNDGDLDLLVCNYVRWSPEIDLNINFTMNGQDRAYGPPTDYEGSHPYLFRNEGDGTFVDVSKTSGIRAINPGSDLPASKALALTFNDLDHDGFLDVLVANDTTQNLLLHNRGDGTFEEIGALSGVGFDGRGNASGAMGIDTAHYLDDDHLAVAISNFANEMTSFYVSWDGQPLRFTDEAQGHGIGSPSRLVLSFGLFFFDADLDGRLDLLQANGHIEDAIQSVQASQTYRQPAQLFWNAGREARLTFVELPRDTTGDLTRLITGRGAAYADIDGDGDLDVVLTQTGGRPMLLRNDQTLGHHWLRVKLTGDLPNRDAIGAEVQLTAGGRTQRRQVIPTRSYLSQMELPITFGLGESTNVDKLNVRWPNGGRQELDLTDISVDRTVEIIQDSVSLNPREEPVWGHESQAEAMPEQGQGS